jgi:hypothetical protein
MKLEGKSELFQMLGNLRQRSRPFWTVSQVGSRYCVVDHLTGEHAKVGPFHMRAAARDAAHLLNCGDSAPDREADAP